MESKRSKNNVSKAVHSRPAFLEGLLLPLRGYPGSGPVMTGFSGWELHSV
jgi:hypothetical protein